LNELVEERTKKQQEGNKEEETVKKQKDSLQESVTRLESVLNQMKKSNWEGMNKEYNQILEKKGDIEKSMSAEGEELKKKMAMLNHVKELGAKSELLRRNIEDNIKYREEKHKIQSLVDEIEKKEQTLKNSDTESLDFEIEKIEKLIEAKNKRLNQIDGKREIYKKNMNEITKELQKPGLKNIDDEYRQMLIKVKTTEMATSDLDKYHHALEHALMKYHAAKMSEINKIIKELWQITYQGQDIDTIEIRSDIDEKAKNTGKSIISLSSCNGKRRYRIRYERKM